MGEIANVLAGTPPNMPPGGDVCDISSTVAAPVVISTLLYYRALFGEGVASPSRRPLPTVLGLIPALLDGRSDQFNR